MSKEITNVLKDERINETNTAANTSPAVEAISEDKQSIPVEVKEEKPKASAFRMIAYTVVLGSVGALSGMQLAKKLNKNNKLFIVSGVLLGASLGYVLFKNWDKNNNLKK